MIFSKSPSTSASAYSASVSRNSIPASRPPAFYNVLEKLRSGDPLTAKEKLIHDQGLVTVLRHIHDELDAAVLEAYGWGDLAVETQDGKTQDARKEELLTRLVALNHERAAEEKRGLIRWLRPDYQNPTKAGDSANFTGTAPDSSSSYPKSTPLNRKFPPHLSNGQVVKSRAGRPSRHLSEPERPIVETGR